MPTQILAAAAAVLTGAYLLLYRWVVTSQHGTTAWWYVALLAGGGLSLLAAALRIWQRVALVLGLVTTTLAALAGLLTIGLLLVPAVGFAAFAVILTRHREQPSAEARAI